MKAHLTTAILVAGLANGAMAQDAPFGTEADAEYAAKLWAIMAEMKLVGDGMIRAFPYEGVAPHWDDAGNLLHHSNDG